MKRVRQRERDMRQMKGNRVRDSSCLYSYCIVNRD